MKENPNYVASGFDATYGMYVKARVCLAARRFDLRSISRTCTAFRHLNVQALRSLAMLSLQIGRAYFKQSHMLTLIPRMRVFPVLDCTIDVHPLIQP